jgi:hypothetical protein
MKTPDETANEILKAVGLPIEMKTPNKAFHDRVVVTQILSKWARDIIRESLNSVDFDQEKERDIGHF